MKTTILAALALLLSGCATIDNAGHSAYDVRAVKDAKGNIAGYELMIKDGKEYTSRQIQFQAVGPAVTITITEGASKAFRGQGIAAKALTILPVNDLTELVK